MQSILIISHIRSSISTLKTLCRMASTHFLTRVIITYGMKKEFADQQHQTFILNFTPQHKKLCFGNGASGGLQKLLLCEDGRMRWPSQMNMLNLKNLIYIFKY